MTAKLSHSSGRARPFSNIEFLFSLRPTNMKLGLENITALLQAIGDPQKALPAVLVAGTNGKGSVTTFLSCILREAGLKTGTFYSPHLFRINERIRVDGDEIPSRVLDGILGELRRRSGSIPFTFFEGITAAAILHFVRRGVDLAVFEVGLGGRLDATRLVEAVITVITGISHDHCEHLGGTRGKILAEKLGITRKGVPLVTHLGGKALVDQARRHCRREGIPLFNVADDTRVELISLTPARMVFDLYSPRSAYPRLEIGMIGPVQLKNAATALRVSEVVDKRVVKVGKKAVREGIKKAFFSGRFQVLEGEPRIVLDVSHNEEALLAALDTLVKISSPRNNVLVFGVMARKKLGRFPARARKAAREIILVPLKDRNAAGREDLVQRFGGESGHGDPGAAVKASPGMGAALKRARKILRPGDTLVILGSHRAVEEAAPFL
ncbi:MAG: hypothetical protein JXB45_06285 [Candidatus Krumholzibacteriota bacterium]|nr:hypothetical protein [Candidatus Krumholzibacteriota bacterium]